MRRRDFVRGAVSAAAVPGVLLGQQANPSPPLPAPVPWTQGLNPKTPIPATEVLDAVATSDPAFFTAAQMATLVRLCDVLMPAIGNKPGAVKAGTPAFLDFLVGSSPKGTQGMYRGGLDWLDGEAMRKYSKGFAQVDAGQADQLLKPWLQTWMTDHPPAEMHAAFVNIVHSDIREATVNSKAWSEAPANKALGTTAKGLYWSPIDADIYGERAGRLKS